jgi:hypothetical protein
MRSLRVFLATLSTVALVGGTLGTVAAQSDGEDGYLTGTMTFVEEVDPGTSTEAGGVLETRGSSAVYDLEMSDPRVSGTLTSSDVATDGYGELRLVFTGMTELVNADGSWTGSWNGVFAPAMGWQLLYELEGQGGFDGLTFYLHGASPELDDGVWEMDGFVVGQPPAE